MSLFLLDHTHARTHRDTQTYARTHTEGLHAIDYTQTTTNTYYTNTYYIHTP